jgi:hypothetical protein
MVEKLIPTDFKIPEILETDKFRLRMLTVNDVKLDYDAVITSINHLQKTNPFGPSNKWPSTNITYEQDQKDLTWHQKEFEIRSSFAYTVMNLDETECLGCMYIYPSKNKNYDAIIILWVRQSELKNGLDEILFSSVKQWIQDKWPFEKVTYPGRDVSWNGF